MSHDTNLQKGWPPRACANAAPDAAAWFRDAESVQTSRGCALQENHTVHTRIRPKTVEAWEHMVNQDMNHLAAWLTRQRDVTAALKRAEGRIVP